MNSRTYGNMFGEDYTDQHTMILAASVKPSSSELVDVSICQCSLFDYFIHLMLEGFRSLYIEAVLVNSQMMILTLSIRRMKMRSIITLTGFVCVMEFERAL